MKIVYPPLVEQSVTYHSNEGISKAESIVRWLKKELSQKMACLHHMH